MGIIFNGDDLSTGDQELIVDTVPEPLPDVPSLLQDICDRYKPHQVIKVVAIPWKIDTYRGIKYQVEKVVHQMPISKVENGRGFNILEAVERFEAVILGYEITPEQLDHHKGVTADLFPGWHTLPRQSVPIRLLEVEGSYRWVRMQDTLPALEKDVRQTIDYLCEDRFIKQEKLD